MKSACTSASFQEGRVSALCGLTAQGRAKVSRDTFTFIYSLKINRVLFLYQISNLLVLWTSARQ